ncbi:MAG: hypothetical protein ACAH17_02025 [Candidatus Paceibacterota bacterium]|jgi:hypothetical protein
MKLQFTVLGARKFNDTIEGQKHDFTKLNVAMDMPDTDNAAGQNVVEMKWGTHENFAQIKDVSFPCVFELDVNPTTKGFEVLGAKPVAASVKAVG